MTTPFRQPVPGYHAFDDREVPLNSQRVFTLLFVVVLVGDLSRSLRFNPGRKRKCFG
jgi:hypothetical protein